MAMTPKEKAEFTRMRSALIRIYKDYQPASRIIKNSEKEYGLDSLEALEMSYDNIQETAKSAVKGIKLPTL